MISNNQISRNDADRFFKDFRRFLERNDRFSDFKNIMLVLGFGVPSWNYVLSYHPDISDNRLIGFKIIIPEPEDWKMAGLVRRYIYFYANQDLRNLINLKNPYYPFSEGTALALAKLSALVHEYTYVNTRMLIKLMDRLVVYLAKNLRKKRRNNNSIHLRTF